MQLTLGTAPNAAIPVGACRAKDEAVRKISHEDAGYTAKAESPDEACGACKHFEATVGCELVADPISPKGWCKLFMAAQQISGADSRQRLALDRSIGWRIDHDGHLHKDETNVCRACVSPYRGEEIPDWEELGLEKDKVYQMLRPPEELERAVETANGKPLLRVHKATSSDDHQVKDTVGAMGTTARWEAPYIKNGLVIWDQRDIDGVESRRKYELSPGYHYKALMLPGDFEGKRYDGRMTDIKFNHWAIVEEGRQGKQVTIDDLVELQWKRIERALMSFARSRGR